MELFIELLKQINIGETVIIIGLMWFGCSKLENKLESRLIRMIDEVGREKTRG